MQYILTEQEYSRYCDAVIIRQQLEERVKDLDFERFEQQPYSNASGSQKDKIIADLLNRRGPCFPHNFIGREDQDCLFCGQVDRHVYHQWPPHPFYPGASGDRCALCSFGKVTSWHLAVSSDPSSEGNAEP